MTTKADISREKLRLESPNLIIPLKGRLGRGKEIDIILSSDMILSKHLTSIVTNRANRFIPIFLGQIGKEVEEYVLSAWKKDLTKYDAICITSITFINLKKHRWSRDRWEGEVIYDLLKFK